MADVATAMRSLEVCARQLDILSRQQAQVEERLLEVEPDYQQHIDDFIAGLWDRYTRGELGRMPGEDMCERLGRPHVPLETRQERDKLVASRRRLSARVSALKSEVDAARSILSALKSEMEATAA